jgi:hypothetical protein
VEASAALAGQADGGVAQDGQQDGGGQFDAVLADLAKMSEGQEFMRQQLAELPEQLRSLPIGDHPFPEGADDPSQFDGGDLDAFGLEDAGADLAAEHELASAFDGMIGQAVAPLAQELQHLRADHADLRETHEAERLLNEFPEAGENPEQLMGLTRQVAALIGAQPNFQLARLVFMASKAAEIRQQEIEEQERQELNGGPPGAARLEGGGGAAGGGGRGQSAADMILGAGPSSVLPFP